MASKKQLSRKEKAEPELSLFELQAHLGVTKHIGGLKATKELIESCHITKDKYVLDVGCGVGLTPCYLAKRYGCKVVGVDLSKRMINRSNEKAKREHVEDRVKFKVADAQNLPFKNAVFDAVISESVLAFVKDKQKAIKEYVRVTKPGGYVGFNECIWIKTPPSTELAKSLSRTVGAKILTSDDLEDLLKGSRLRDIVVKTYKINVLSEPINQIRRLGFKGFLRGWYRFLSLYISSPACRRYMKDMKKGIGPITKNFLKYAGYGIHVGRK